jgi:hypothetical protein
MMGNEVASEGSGFGIGQARDREIMRNMTCDGSVDRRGDTTESRRTRRRGYR